MEATFKHPATRAAPAYRGAIVTSSLPSDPHGSQWAVAVWWERQMAKV